MKTRLALALGSVLVFGAAAFGLMSGSALSAKPQPEGDVLYTIAISPEEAAVPLEPLSQAELAALQRKARRSALDPQDECMRAPAGSGTEAVTPMCGGPGTGSGCWQSTSRHGTQTPYETFYNYVYQRVNWCGNGTNVTSAQSITWTDVYGGCGTQSGPFQWVWGGGVGQSSIDYRSQAEFVCAGSFYETVWMTRRYYGNGAHATAGHH